MAGRKHKKSHGKNRFKETWERLNEGWTGMVFYVFLGILVAFSVHQVSGMALGTGLPIVTVSSESMIPTLNVGDIVIIRGEETYETGEIIVFEGWETEPIIHRVVAEAEGESVEKLEGWNELTDEYIAEMAYNRGKIYITKGDNNPRCDQCSKKLPVTESLVYGKAVARIPYLGWVKILAVEWFVKDPLIGILLVIVLGAAYYVYKKI
ncbi:MAG: signal peptidase I [archaeon]|nr:MAG: signal peptidase I [archaeon]